jgi:hypothetical protein
VVVQPQSWNAGLTVGFKFGTARRATFWNVASAARVFAHATFGVVRENAIPDTMFLSLAIRCAMSCP